MSSSAKSFSHGVVLEIGGAWLKAAEVGNESGGIAMTRLYLEKIDDNAGSLSSAVARAWKALKPGKSRVVACLPRQMVNIRMIELPSTDPVEIHDMVDLQAGKQTPYSKDEIVYDYKILGEGRGSGYTRIMMAIIQRSALNECFYAMEEAGIEVEKMSVSTEALVNWFARAGRNGTGGGATAILDVDSFYTDFLVISGSGLVFSRSILAGADQLFEDSGASADKFVKDVKNAIETCRSEQRGLNIGKLVVSGAGTRIDGLAERLEQDTGCKVEKLESLSLAKKLPKNPSPDDPQYRTVSLTPVVGAGAGALEFNLVPDPVRLRRGLEEKSRRLSSLGIMIMGALMSVLFFASLKILFRIGQLALVRREYAEVAPKAREVDKMMEIINIINNQRDPNLEVINLLYEIRKKVPAEIKIANLEIDRREERFAVEGVAPSSRDVNSLVKDLDQAVCFKDVKSTSVTRDKASNMYRFQLIGRLKKP